MAKTQSPEKPKDPLLGSSLELSMKDRLRVLIAHLNLTQRDFASGAEIESTSISRLYAGAVKTLSAESMARIVLKYRVSPLWLLLGGGDMFLPDTLALQNKDEAKFLSEVESFIVDTFRDLPKPKRDEITKYIEFSTGKSYEDYLKALVEQKKEKIESSKRLEGMFSREKGDARSEKPKTNKTSPENQKPKIQIINRTFLAPYLGVVPAGKPIPVHVAVNESRPLSVDFLKPGDKARDFYSLTIKGESMKDLGIYHNDLIAIRKKETAESGDIVVALVDDEATLKEFVLGYDSIKLRPHNKLMKSMVFRSGDDRNFQIQGVLAGIMRPTN